MLSKNSTKSAAPSSPKREKHVSTEDEARAFVQEWIRDCPKNAVIWLEGPLGVGKSTCARWMMDPQNSGNQQFKGSPTYSLIHEYPGGIHVDLYRIKDEKELQERGVFEYLAEKYSEDELRIFIEWGSRFPATMAEFSKNFEAYVVEIEFVKDGSNTERLIRIYPLSH